MRKNYFSYFILCVSLCLGVGFSRSSSAHAGEPSLDGPDLKESDFHSDSRHFKVEEVVDDDSADTSIAGFDDTEEQHEDNNLNNIEAELEAIGQNMSAKDPVSTSLDNISPELLDLPQRKIAQAQKRPLKRAGVAGSQTSANDSKKQNLQKAERLVKSGQYTDAANLLFNMARSPQYAPERAQIEYILGRVLFELKLYQTSAFVFYDVVRLEGKNPKSRYLRQSLERLSIAGDALDSDLLLKFAVSQVTEADFPETERDILFYRTGELRLQEKKFREAAGLFAKVRASSNLFSKSRYNLGLALTEAGDLDAAGAAFDDLVEMGKNGKVTDRNRVDGILAKARVLYQKKDFAGSAEAYREIPRDTEQWHESLFELSWALLRMAKFRSALSIFHSLHSSYYDDFYQPESLLLRAIVYLYICRYDEMEKTLDLFERIYKPVQSDVRASLEGDRNPMLYYKEINRIAENFDAIKAQKAGSRTGLKIPFIVGRQILKEGDVRKAQNYLRKLYDEHKRIVALPPKWQATPVGRYARKLVDRRIEATRAFVGKLVRRHMILMQVDLRDLFEQVGFLRFESTSGRKEVVKKEMQGKGLAKQRVDSDSSRDFFIQNGYEFWPFTGEYWLDEIGNYQYLGVQACE